MKEEIINHLNELNDFLISLNNENMELAKVYKIKSANLNTQFIDMIDKIKFRHNYMFELKECLKLKVLEDIKTNELKLKELI